MQINPDAVNPVNCIGITQRFNRINSCRSIPTARYMEKPLWLNLCFNRINSCRSIPTQVHLCHREHIIICFNRINSCRSIPTTAEIALEKCFIVVSIVSIHADQSRQSLVMHTNSEISLGFNRINSCRSIPTIALVNEVGEEQMFQSYQFMQINPDKPSTAWQGLMELCFNRINSCRSIPT